MYPTKKYHRTIINIIFLFPLLFCFVVTVIIPFGLSLAVLCTSKMKGVGFFRAAFFIPDLIGGIVLGYIWQFIFNNVVLKWTFEPFQYNSSMLSKYNTGFMAIILVYIWQYAGIS